MNFIPFPPDGLVKRRTPFLCRVVGFAFMVVGGMLGVALVPLCLFADVEDPVPFALAFLGGAILNVAMGFAVVKYLPAFMLSRFRKLGEKPPCQRYDP